MAITILPLEEKDIPTFVQIELAAFASHPRIPMLWPRGYTPDLYAYMEKRKHLDFPSPSHKFIKAVDSGSGEIVGVSHFSLHLDPGENAKEQPMEEDEEPPGDWPEGGNWALKRYFAIKSHWLPVESFEGRPYIQVELLLVHPRHQHKGIGSQLLDFAVREADRRGVAVGLESTPAGLALYKRTGFQEAKVIKADMKDFGWDKPYDREAAKRVWMVREARSVRVGS